MSRGFEPATDARPGLSVAWNAPGQPFFNNAGELVESLLARLEGLADYDELLRLVERLLGPQSFALGVIYGVGEGFVMGVADLLGLVKTFVLADLYDQARRNPDWRLLNPAALAAHLTAHTLEEYFGDAMSEAAQARDALIKEVAAIFASPKDFFGQLGDQYVQKFQRFVVLSADPGLGSQFQAGRVFGEVLLDVLMLIGGGAAVAKGLSKIPRLAGLARGMKGRFSRRVGAAGGAGEASGSPPLPPARSPRVSSTAERGAVSAAVEPLPKPPWQSPAGLNYGFGSKQGDRLQHVLAHTSADPAKPIHSVFTAQSRDALNLVDEAWVNRGVELRPGVFEVPMGRVVGTAGESAIRIVVKPGTQDIVTAFPIK